MPAPTYSDWKQEALAQRDENRHLREGLDEVERRLKMADDDRMLLRRDMAPLQAHRREYYRDRETINPTWGDRSADDPVEERAAVATVETEGADFDYAKADPEDGWIDFNPDHELAHGDPQTVKLDTSTL